VGMVKGFISTPAGFAMTVLLERRSSDGGPILKVYEAAVP
jgi:hypothetical protein